MTADEDPASMMPYSDQGNRRADFLTMPFVQQGPETLAKNKMPPTQPKHGTSSSIAVAPSNIARSGTGRDLVLRRLACGQAGFYRP